MANYLKIIRYPREWPIWN